MNISFKKILEYIINTCTVLILLLPLYINSSYYFPFITPRNFAFRILVEVMLTAYALLLVRDWKRYTIGRQPIVLAVAGLLIWMAISSLINGDFMYSFWSNAERMEGLVHLLHMLGLLVVLIGVYKDKLSWLRLLRSTFFISFVISLIAVAQSLGVDFFIESAGGTRVTSTLGNATFVAAYALLHMFIGVVILWQTAGQSDRWWQKTLHLFGRDEHRIERFTMELYAMFAADILLIIFHFSSKVSPLLQLIYNPALLLFFLVPQVFIIFHYYGKKFRIYGQQLFVLSIIVINFIALYRTQTRGALIGFVVSVICIVVAAIFNKRLTSRVRIGLLSLLIVGAFVISSVFIFKEAAFIKDSPTLRRISEISVHDTTSESRLLTWKAALDGFTEKPIHGWGEEKFYVVFNAHFPQEIYRHANSRIWFDRAHNIFVQYLTNGGAIGFLIYISIFISAIWLLIKKHKQEAGIGIPLILIAGLVAYSIQNAVVFDSLNSFIPLYVILAYISFLTTRDPKGSSAKNFSPSGQIVISIISLIAFLILLFFINLIPQKKNTDFITALRDSRTATDIVSLSSALSQLRDVIDNGVYLGTFEMRQVYSDHIVEWINSGQLPQDYVVSLIDPAKDMLYENIQEQPDNARHYAFLSNLLLTSGQFDQKYDRENIDVLLNGIEWSPTRTPFYNSLGRSYIALGEFDQARLILEKAISLSPDVVDAHIEMVSLLATLEQTADDEISTIERLRSVRPLSLSLALDYVETLRQLEKYDLAVTILRNQVSVRGEYPVLYIELAKTYIAAGQTDSAQEAARRAIELDERARPFVEDIVEL